MKTPGHNRTDFLLKCRTDFLLKCDSDGQLHLILLIEQIIEQAGEFNISLFICFVVFRKAFDTVGQIGQQLSGIDQVNSRSFRTERILDRDSYIPH